MGAYISPDDLDELEKSIGGCCQRIRNWINKLCGYYNNDKEHL